MSDQPQNTPKDPNAPKDPKASKAPKVVAGGVKPFYLRPPFLGGAAAAVVAIIAVIAFMGSPGNPVAGPAAKAQSADNATAASDWKLGRPGDILMGSPDAPVKMVEYASMTCPHCAAFNLFVFPDIKKKYIDTGLVQYTLREFPTPPVSLSIAGFMLARCTGKDHYYGAIDALFRTQPVWVRPDPQEARQGLEKIARQFGLSKEQFEKCVKNEDELKRIQKVVTAGHDIFGINGTPSFVVNGRKANLHEATFEAFDSLIKESLPKGTKVPDYTPSAANQPAGEPAKAADPEKSGGTPTGDAAKEDAKDTGGAAAKAPDDSASEEKTDDKAADGDAGDSGENGGDADTGNPK